MPGLFARALAVVSIAFVSACSNGLEAAKRDYDKGRAAEAKARLVALEDESAGWNGRARATYALYRGLAHLAVGDRALAGVWLDKAKGAESAEPGTLSGDDQTRLRLALDTVSAPSASAP